MFRRSLLGAGLAVAAALAVTPFALADGDKEMGAGKSEYKACVNEVVIDKPFGEIVGKVPLAIEKAGLVPLAQVDWSRIGTGPGIVPGARLDGGYGEIKSSNIRTYIVDTTDCARMIGKAPEHALYLPGRFVIFEKGDNTVLLHTKPSEALKKMSEMKGEDFKKHETHVRQLEDKLQEVANILRGTKSS